MNDNKLNRYIIILLTVSLMTVIGLTMYLDYNLINLTQENRNKLEAVIQDITTYNLYNPDNAENVKVRGVYFPNGDYYCVSTKDRDPYDIRMTDYHEMCHAFVGMDRDHFCNFKPQTKRNIEDYINQS